MYNGIGLPTPRGSGTSGYIQRNLSFIEPQRSDFPKHKKQENIEKAAPKIRKLNNEITEHHKKRKIEIELIHYKEKLEAEKNKSPEEIEKMVSDERLRLKKIYEEESKKKEIKEEEENVFWSMKNRTRKKRDYSIKKAIPW